MPQFLSLRHCSDCNLKLSIFKYLNESELDFVNRNRQEVVFETGETIFKQGAPMTHIICLTHGMAKVYMEGIDKKNLMLKIIKPVEMVGGPGLFVDNLQHYSVVTLRKSMACYIDVIAFKELLIQNKEFMIAFIQHMNHQSLRMFDKLLNLTQKQMPGRIADLILYLSGSIYEKQIFDLEISRQDIADFTAMTKESAIRVLKEFRDSGIINLEGNRLEIINLASLEQISRSG